MRSNIKRRAESTLHTLQQILAAELEEISEAATVNLPQIDNIQRTIRHQRHGNQLQNPPNRAEIPPLPQEYTLTLAMTSSYSMTVVLVMRTEFHLCLKSRLGTFIKLTTLVL